MNLLRAIAGVWVSLSLPLEYLFSAGVVGYTSEWKNGKEYVTAGSHPALLAWSIVGIGLFALLIKIDAEESPAGTPSGLRRFSAFLIDFWFSLAVLASLGGLLPLWIESLRTGHFSWHFERDYSVQTDQIFAFPFVLLTMALMFLYFAWPLTQGKQTVGCFITCIRTTPPFGDRGSFAFREAARRIWFEIKGLTLFWGVKGGRDSQGRTWYDRETNCTVILIKYERREGGAPGYIRSLC